MLQVEEIPFEKEFYSPKLNLKLLLECWPFLRPFFHLLAEVGEYVCYYRKE